MQSATVSFFTAPRAYAQSSSEQEVPSQAPSEFPESPTPEALAQDADHAELGIIAVLVEDALLENGELKDLIFTYAQNAQNRMPHTRSLVIGISPAENPYKISTVLEKLYYEGVDNDLLDANPFNDDSKKEDDNHLVGVVIIGNVPLPVVYDEDEGTSPSMYPYTDFYRKRYIYNHETGRFETNLDSLNPTPDVWHGVIVAPTKTEPQRTEELKSFFIKNNLYSSSEPNEYNSFNKRMLYYNFPAVERKLNILDYNNYLRHDKYVEETIFRRYNRHLLQEIIKEVAAELEPEKAQSDRTLLIDDASIEAMSDTTAEMIINKYIFTLKEALKIYLGKLNSVVEETGRWGTREFDSFASLITLRDEYMKNKLVGKTIELEGIINQAVQEVQQDIPIIEKVTINIDDRDGNRFAGGQDIIPVIAGYDEIIDPNDRNKALEDFLKQVIADDIKSGLPISRIGENITEEDMERFRGYTKDDITFVTKKSGITDLELYAFSDGYRFKELSITEGAPGIAPIVNVHTTPPDVHYGYEGRAPTPKFGITSAEQCGLLRGQKRPPGVPILENNSVLAQANHTFNPTGHAFPPPQDNRIPTESYPYNVFGGCVTNNSIPADIEYESNGETVRQTIGPDKCSPRSAVNPVFDYAGSKEVDFEFADPADPPSSSPFGGRLGSQCGIENISYNPNWIFPEGHYWTYQYWLRGYQTPMLESAYCRGSFPFNLCFDPFFGIRNPLNQTFRDWSQMITQLFLDMESEGLLELGFDRSTPEGMIKYLNLITESHKVKDGGLLDDTIYFGWPHLQVDYIISSLFDPFSPSTSESYTVMNNDVGEDLTFVFDAQKKYINSVIRHQEPNQEALETIQKFMTPNTPADAIRYVEWHTGDNNWDYYTYPNMFRVEGVNLSEVTSDLARMIDQKDRELNQLLGGEKNIVQQFFADNPELLEPILWRNLTIDQKHQMIIEKYLNRDSFLPYPPNSLAPVGQPAGYEVMHLVAEGDETSFQFAIHAPKISDFELQDDGPPDEKPDGPPDDGSPDEEPAEEEEIEDDSTSLFVCGPPEGVEIWEWFGAVQCWIEEVIDKLPEVIKLDEPYGANLPAPEEQDPDPNAGIDVLSDTSLSVDDPNKQPSALEVQLDIRTLVSGEKVPLKAKVRNSEGKLIIGFIDDPMKFEVADPDLANFDKAEVEIFLGQERANLTAVGQQGETSITVRIGAISETIPISVVEGIQINLSQVRMAGSSPPQYKVTAVLTDLEGNPITNISTRIRISPANPTDGIFAERILKLENGVGSAIFFPNPAIQEVSLFATHPVYVDGQARIIQPPNEPFKVVIDAPKDVTIDRTVEIPVRVTDVFGVPSRQFNGSVQLKVTDKTKKYGSISSAEAGSSDPAETEPPIEAGSIEVSIVNGEGMVELRAGVETGYIKLIASHGDLIPGKARIPVIVKVGKSDWDGMFTQNLFASFLGFPAGNFTQEDYFAGTHLFNGKTEAVFAFISVNPPAPLLTIQPNYSIQPEEPKPIINVRSFGNRLGISALNQGTLQPLFSTVAPLDFEAVELFEDAVEYAPGTLYYESTNSRYRAQRSEAGIELFNSQDDLILVIQKDELKFISLDYELFYEAESEFEWLELVLASEEGEAGRLHMNFKPRTINPDDLEMPDHIGTRISFSGTSTIDPTGLVLYNKTQVAKGNALPEHFGFEGKNKYILRFAGGSPIGEATMYNLPFNAVLLGDPTIRLVNRSVSSLNYDSTIGRQIFQDPEGTDVASLTNFDFNRDGIQDVAVVMKDGRIRLLEGGATEPLYRDRGDIAFFSDGALSVMSFDFKYDGYEDLIVATKEGRLAILHNDAGVITRSDIQIKVGKQLYQIQKADMDADGYPDLITTDSRGDIRIFYNQTPEHRTCADLSKCPVPPELQIPENGKLIGNYGLSLNLEANLKADLQIRYPGMPEPEGAPKHVPGAKPIMPESSPEVSADNPWGLPQIEIPEFPDLTELAEFADKDTSGDISEDEGFDVVKSLAAERDKAQETGQPNIIPTLPWIEGDLDEVYFAPITDFESNNAFVHNGQYFTVTKTVINRDRPTEPNLDLDEALKYSITIQSNQNINELILVDTVPDSLVLNKTTIQCTGMGCEAFNVSPNNIYLFLGPLNLQANQPITITYEAAVKHTPRSAVMLKKFTKALDYNLPFTAQNIDNYIDLLVSPMGNSTGQLIAYYTLGPRDYGVTSTRKEEVDIPAMDDNLACIEALSTIDVGGDPNDEDYEPPEDFLETMEEKLKSCPAYNVSDPSKDLMGNSMPTPEQCSADPVACISDAMDKAAFDISELFCSGGGCFPMPYNMAFLSPQGVPFAMPLISFPATNFIYVPAPVPIPFPAFFGLVPLPLGATTIPGPFNSAVRVYTMPTLTGGMGIAVCWGKYMGEAPVPPPLIPIPYPPPIGNCMTIALPMGANPACKEIKKAISSAMQAANSVVSDVNSGIAAVNNAGGIPDSVKTANQQGAGGLEISLATNLGEMSKFEPPAKSFSNIHIPGFDSIGGVVAGWLDRQILEIVNKLLTLPTIRIILPDFGSLWANDWEILEKKVEAFTNNLSGLNKSVSADAGLDALETFESEMRQFNTNQFDQLYQIIDEIPIFKINQHHVDFKIPWLSYAQIKDLIRDAKEAQTFYLKQYNELKETLETYKCPDTEESRLEMQIVDCAGKKALAIFVVDLDTFINSIQDNIDALNDWANFPKEFILIKKQLADYLYQLSHYMDSISTAFGGYLNTLQTQIVAYAEFWFTVIAIKEGIKEIFDIFINFEDNCDICTNERFANFGWYSLLGLVLPDIPVIDFPKWPDLTLDLSNFNAQINIELPVINFVMEPITLPRIPRIVFPDLPDVGDLQLLAQIPALPIIPLPPEMPELPELPAMPILDLPTLPPPPKLPDVGAQFEVISGLLEQLLQIWCMVKKSFSPVPEAYLSDHITLLTNRPSYMIPLDFLKPQIGKPALLQTDFNELRIEVKTYLGLRISLPLEKIQEIAEKVNEVDTDFALRFERMLARAVRDKLDEFKNNELRKLKLDEALDFIENFDESITEEIEKLEVGLQEEIEKSIGAAFEEIDNIFRNFERWMQEGPDWLTEKMGEGTQAANQAFVNLSATIQNEWDKLGLDDEMRKAFNNVYKVAIIKYISNPPLGITDINDFLEANDLMNFNIEEDLSKLINEVDKGIKSGGINIAEDTAGGIEEYFENYFKIDQGENQASLPNQPIQPELKAIIESTMSELAQAVESINNAKTVDYTKVKKDLNVPDYQMPIKPGFESKMQAMRLQLLEYAEELRGEAKMAEETNDVFAWIQSSADGPLPIQLASEVVEPEPIQKTSTGPKTITLQLDNGSALAQVSGKNSPSSRYAAAQAAPNSGGSGACVGTCLIDPVTEQIVQFIPHFDTPATAQTSFIPTQSAGHSNVVYSDGSSLYLKQDLVVPPNITTNIPPNVPGKAFELNKFITIGDSVQPAMEAVNMLTVGITENGGANFNWAEPTHPDVYGYGIELERSILGYDADRQENKLSDIRIILLPPEPDGSTPEVIAAGINVPFNSLITSLSDPQEARDVFGIEAGSIITNANEVVFKTVQGASIKLSKTRAVYFVQYNGPDFRMQMDNGFYHIRMAWFDRLAHQSNYNHAELLAPQVYVDAQPPIDILFDREFTFPVYTSGSISAGEIFTDLSGAFKYYWDVNIDGIPDETGPVLEIPHQKDPREFFVDLIATVDISDPGFERFTKRFKVTIYVPKITLDGPALKESDFIKGSMEPLLPGHDLTDIPFSIFRKRWGIWKNIGLIKKRADEETNPPISDKAVSDSQTYYNNYYAANQAGDYEIRELTTGPADVIIRHQAINDAARVKQATGQIEILDPDFEVKALPATTTLPTRVVVVKKNFDTVLANIYFVADSDTNVQIVDVRLDQSNIRSVGVVLGDANGTDSVIAKNMPAHVEISSGSAVIFDEKTEVNIAMVSPSGSVHFMRQGYSLRIKNQGRLEERVIFEILDDRGRPIFDLFIGADFNSLKIRQEEEWTQSGSLISYLNKNLNPIYASVVNQGDPTGLPIASRINPVHSSLVAENNLSTDLLPSRTNSAFAAPSIPKPPSDEPTTDDNPILPSADEPTTDDNPILPSADEPTTDDNPILTFTDEPAVPESPFADLAPGDPNYAAIIDLYERRIISGYADGLFRPNAKLSRAEFVKIALGATSCFDCSQPSEETKETYGPQPPFPDVRLPAWYNYCVAIAKDIGMVTGYGDGLFRPNNFISRAEAAAVLIRQSEIDVQEAPEGFFADVSGTAWYKDYVYTAVQIGLIPVTNSLVFPNEEISRGEFAFMASGVPNLQDCKIEEPELEDECKILVNYDPLNDPENIGKKCCACIDNLNQNDTDSDGIIDACDIDIDADGVENTLCFFDDTGLIKTLEAEKSEDNCIFTPNPRQDDRDTDGTGDACVPIDQCPGIPEDYDGIDDLDGCPEVLDLIPEDEPGTYVNKGPLCQLLDYEADIVDGDIIMTAITDVDTHEVIYEQSNEVTY